MTRKPGVGSRNGTIDFLRFLCCIIIVIRHASWISLISEKHQLISRGSLCVEFFFIVSGYLMVCSASKLINSPVPSDKIGTATYSFILKKIKALMPNLAVAYILAMIFICVSRNGLSLRLSLRFFAGEIYKPVLFATGGFGSMSEIWYICFMLLVMTVLFPLLLKNFDLFTRVIAPVVAVVLIGFLARSQKSLVSPDTYLGFIYRGLIRALAEIALGAALYHLIEYFKRLNLTSFARVAVSALQVVFWVGSIGLMALNDRHYDFFILLMISLSVTLAFSHQGIFAGKMDNRVNGFLGKLSLTIYLSHRWIAVTLDNLYPRLTESGIFGFTGNENVDVPKMWIMYLICVILSCIVVYALSALLKKASPRLTGKIKRLLVR